MYLRRSGATDLDEFAVGTAAGTIRPKIVSSTQCEVDMGRASLTSKDFPAGPSDGRGFISVGDTEMEFQHVSIGNPQCAIEIPGGLEALRALDLPAIGPALENDSRFTNRTNVSFWTETGKNVICARIFERGMGETLSSGTGATGAAVAAYLRGMPRPVNVELDGGLLLVGISDALHITLTGWAVPVFDGELTTEFIAELEQL